MMEPAAKPQPGNRLRAVFAVLLGVVLCSPLLQAAAQAPVGLSLRLQQTESSWLGSDGQAHSVRLRSAIFQYAEQTSQRFTGALEFSGSDLRLNHHGRSEDFNAQGLGLVLRFPLWADPVWQFNTHLGFSLNNASSVLETPTEIEWLHAHWQLQGSARWHNLRLRPYARLHALDGDYSGNPQLPNWRFELTPQHSSGLAFDVFVDRFSYLSFYLENAAERGAGIWFAREINL